MKSVILIIFLLIINFAYAQKIPLATETKIYIIKLEDKKISSNVPLDKKLLAENDSCFFYINKFDFGHGVKGFVTIDTCDDVFVNDLNLTLWKNDQEYEIGGYVEDMYAPECSLEVIPQNGMVRIFIDNYLNTTYTSYENDTINILYGWVHSPQKNFYNVFSFFDELKQITPLATVCTFINALENADSITAYNTVKVPNRENLIKFSSTNGFGEIEKIFKDTIYLISKNRNKAQVYVSAIYYDTANYAKEIQEIFILEQISGRWFISDLNIVDYAVAINYEGNTFAETLSIYTQTKKDMFFDMYLVKNPEENYSPGGHSEGFAKKTGKNKYVFKDGKCKIFFQFSDDRQKVKVSENGKCEKYRCPDCRFERIFSKP